ncbi:MAG: hypothetical protein ACK45B_15795 [Limisphaerales bacterium]
MKLLLLTTCAALLAAGCATKSTPEQRRTERAAAYASLTPETRSLVDAGQIRVGMSEDAVYIAWGKPAEVLQREDASGLRTIWLYEGGWMEESRYWAYRQVGRGQGGMALERYLVTDYHPRTFIRAELIFVDGVLKEWRTHAAPR